jgi:acetoacetate decarboxylase
MSYVATPEEIAVFEEYSLKPNFSQEAIFLDFTTTEEFIKSILPPKFSPAEKPTGHIYVGTMESRLCGEFDCAIVSIDVVFNGKKGIYMIEMLISEDFPVTWGREVWGETKKTAQVKMYRAGDYRYAYVERNGVRLIDIEGKFGDDLPPVKREGKSFEIKAYPSSTGKGLQWDPIVNELAIYEDFPRRSTGVGRVTIRGNRNNPLHTIPILSITDFEYSSGLVAYEVLEEHALGVGNAYLPYLIGRHYDDIRTFKVGNIWAKLKEKPKEDETFPVRTFDSPGFSAL